MPSLSPVLSARIPRAALAPALALVLPLALAACGGFGPKQEFPPVCPKLALLKDGADITRFSPRGQDVTDLVLDGRLTAVPANCTYGKGSTVAASLKVTMDLARGPAAGGRDLDVPYFIAVSRAGQVVDKQVYTLRASFPPNVERMSVTSDQVDMVFPVSAEVPASAYQIFVGFQLTPDELQRNRSRGPR